MSEIEHARRGTGRPSLARSKQMTASILESAAVLFIERGYSGTSMDEIASLSGVGKQAIYSRFPTKDDLFVRVYNQKIAEVYTSLPQPQPGAGQDEIELIRAACLAMTISMLDPSVVKLCRIAYGEAARFPELGDQVRRKSIEEFVEPVSTLVKAAQDRGLLTGGDSKTLSHSIMVGCYAFPFMEALLGDQSMNEVSARKAYFECAWPVVIGNKMQTV